MAVNEKIKVVVVLEIFVSYYYIIGNLECMTAILRLIKYVHHKNFDSPHNSFHI